MWSDSINQSLKDKYELYNYGNAVEILTQAHETEWIEICDALERFQISVGELMEGGGNESAIPKKMANSLKPLNWEEIKISADLLVKMKKRNPMRLEEFTIENYLDGYNIDYVKNRVAFDMEWNSKDQTFDRDLYAFRAFHETGIIDCGIIMTRSISLDPLFKDLGIMAKYGASTTQMGKLTTRVNARRQGGCPLFIIGITPTCVVGG